LEKVEPKIILRGINIRAKTQLANVVSKIKAEPGDVLGVGGQAALVAILPPRLGKKVLEV
jgi:hypothetical protein